MRKLVNWISTFLIAVDIAYIAVDKAIPWFITNITDIHNNIRDLFTAT